MYHYWLTWDEMGADGKTPTRVARRIEREDAPTAIHSWKQHLDTRRWIEPHQDNPDVGDLMDSRTYEVIRSTSDQTSHLRPAT